MVELSTVFVLMATVFLMTAIVTWWVKPKEIDLPERIRVLTSSLNDAAKSIGEIEEAMKQREALVQRLQRDAETASRLSALNKEQVDAVAQVLKGEIEKDQQANFWTTQLLALFYTLLGVGLAELYHFVLRRWRRRRLVNRSIEPQRS
jgi:hypothetical protein